MKRIKQFLCAAAALCLLLTLMPAARAAYGEETFEGKTWEEVVAGLMDEYHVDPERVAMGYYNTVTGETHYHRGDQYMVAASMYKVPLNMVFTERIANGEMDWTSIVGGYRNERVPVAAIVQLEQAPANSITSLNPSQAYAYILSSCSGLKVIHEAMDGLHATISAIVLSTPVKKLKCLPDKASAVLCYESTK